MGQLAEELRRAGAPDTPALTKVEQRLDTMRGALGALVEGADPAHVPRRQPG